MVCSSDTVDVNGAPKEIKILPLGLVHSQKGDFSVDDESVELIRQQFKDRKLDLVIDYEHQTLKDIQAPAGGWIKDIYKGEDAVIAKVEWTPRAEEYLKNKEYKYLSPVVLVRKKDRKATAIHSVALTNTPAIDGMFALVNSTDIEDFQENEEETNMDLKEVAAMLGLPETATEDEIKAAMAAAKKVIEGEKDKQPPTPGTGEKAEVNSTDQEACKAEGAANSVVLQLLGLKADAKTEDVAAAVMSLKAGSNTDAEILALKKELQERAADDLVELALKDGKITAAQKEWAKTYALSDKNGFKSFMDKAPVVVPQGKLDLKDAPETKKTDFDMEILKNCGISEEDAKKYFKED